MRNIKQMEEKRRNQGTHQNLVPNTPRERWNFHFLALSSRRGLLLPWTLLINRWMFDQINTPNSGKFPFFGFIRRDRVYFLRLWRFQLRSWFWDYFEKICKTRNTSWSTIPSFLRFPQHWATRDWDDIEIARKQIAKRWYWDWDLGAVDANWDGIAIEIVGHWDCMALR